MRRWTPARRRDRARTQPSHNRCVRRAHDTLPRFAADRPHFRASQHAAPGTPRPRGRSRHAASALTVAYDASPYHTGAIAADASGVWRSLGKWSVGFGLFVTLLALFTSLQLFQLTAEGAAKRTLRRSVAAVTEIDPLIHRNFDELQRSAENAAPGETVQLRDFPVVVPLTAAEVTGMSKQRLRDVLLDRTADVMYSQGAGPLRTPAAKDGDVGRFSIAGLTQHG